MPRMTGKKGKTDENDFEALDRLAHSITRRKLRPLTPKQRRRWEAARGSQVKTKTDWTAFFIDSIDAIHKRFKVVLDAGGCRETWLQAELFYAGYKRGHDLQTNHHSLGGHMRADLSCDDPPTMLAEIKVVGALDSLKMRGLIEADVQRMMRAKATRAERYMILVIRNLDERTTLGTFLDRCQFPGKCTERKWPAFRVRIWRL